MPKTGLSGVLWEFRRDRPLAVALGKLMIFQYKYKLSEYRISELNAFGVHYPKIQILD